MISEANNALKKSDEPSWLIGPDVTPIHMNSPEQHVDELVVSSPSDEEAKTTGTPSWVEPKPTPPRRSPVIPKQRFSLSPPQPRNVIETNVDHVDDTCYCCGCRIDPVLITFQLFHIAAGAVSVVSISTNFYVFTTMIFSDSDLREVLLRIYAIMFAIVAVLIETDLDMFMKYFLILQSWFVRGLLYAFIGILTGIAHLVRSTC
jgi:hypothetical protein